MMKVLKSALTEYGIAWTINRSLYSAKLKMMRTLPFTEKFFEKKVNIKRVDIFNFNLDMISEFLLELRTDSQEEVIEIADKAINGVITGFSSIELNFGKPINWHLNPLTGHENAKDFKWYKINDFDEKAGDIKVIWEASRLTHFLYFSRAFLISKDRKYYEAFSEQLEDWIKHNTYSYGSNYKCGQEATLRMINVLISYTVFEKYNLATDFDKMNVEKLVEGSYKKVLSNFFYAHKCIKNNHTFTEILGLIIGAWCSENDDALSKGYKLMDHEISNQFLPDGGFTQYSFNYHRFTLQIMECLFKISGTTGICVTETERLKNSVILLYQVQEENGDVPNYGSNDGALIFPLSTCGYRDFRPVLNTVYALIEGKRIYNSGDYDEELLWFGETSDLPEIKIQKKSIAFEDSGYYVLRHAKGFLITFLQDYKSRPAHMDQLHIDLWYKGLNILCDSGTYSYASELGKELTSTVGHNTVKLSGIDQMNKRGAFLVTDWTERRAVKYDYENFTGTMVSKNGYKHTRSITKTGQGYKVIDDVRGVGEICELLFHTPCEVRVNSEGFELFDRGELICTIAVNGVIELKKVIRSLYYLKENEINCVSVSCSMKDNKCSTEFNVFFNDLFNSEGR